MFFQPWSTSKGQLPFQFVLSMPDIETGMRMNIPAIWPASEEMSWLTKQIEKHAFQIKTREDYESYCSGAHVELSELLGRVAFPGHFQHYTFKPHEHTHEIPCTFDTSYAREHGFNGLRLDMVQDRVAIENPFSNWDLLVHMVAKVVAKGQGALTAAMAMEG